MQHCCVVTARHKLIILCLMELSSILCLELLQALFSSLQHRTSRQSVARRWGTADDMPPSARRRRATRVRRPDADAPPGIRRPDADAPPGVDVAARRTDTRGRVVLERHGGRAMGTGEEMVYAASVVGVHGERGGGGGWEARRRCRCGHAETSQ